MRNHGEPIDKLARAGLNLIQQALSIFDSDLRLVVSNARYQEMFALPDALVAPGARFEDTIAFLVERGEYGPQPDPAAAVRQRVDTARAFKPHYMERQRANGSWISVEGAPLPQGGWVAVYTDITEIKIQEQLLRARSAELSGQVLAHAERLGAANRELAATNAALEEAKREITEIEARTRLVTEMMPAHIAHLDGDLVYTHSNRRLSVLMPGAPENVVGLHVTEALGSATYARIEPFLRRALQGESTVCEVTHAESGRRIRVAFNPDPPPDDASTASGVYVLSTDITRETQARAALTQTRKRELAAQLTSGLAHDFANLLTIILGLQGKLAATGGLPVEAHDAVRATIAAARRGGTLLQRIGEISGSRALEPRAIDMGDLLDELRTMAQPSLPEGTRLEIQAAPFPGPLVLDPGAVQDSLLNLVLNARDAIGERPDGAIILRATPVRDTWLEITVEDNGPGFSDEALRRGLDPFFTTKGGEGSGLGLAMVFDQASLSGGSVRLANRPGGGASVTLRLPLRLPTGEQPTPARLVLLVEDSAAIRRHVREMLCNLGHRVLEADTVADARNLALIPEIDFVLSDIQLAGAGTGLDLLRDLHRLRPGLATGLMTSLSPRDRLRQQGQAMAGVLQKPFEPADLEAFIHRCIQAAAPQTANTVTAQ